MNGQFKWRAKRIGGGVICVEDPMGLERNEGPPKCILGILGEGRCLTAVLNENSKGVETVEEGFVAEIIPEKILNWEAPQKKRICFCFVY